MLVPGFDHDTLIARTGFARVYRAHQLSFDRDVVIKVVEQVPPDEAGRRRFADRCAAMGRLTGHPGILTVIDSGFTADGHPYLITPFCPDGSMADRVAAGGPLVVDEVLLVARVTTDALAVAHRAGLLHLDVTPANIAVSPFGQPVLADFGFATLGGTGPHEITAAVAIDHVAPEVLNSERATAAADLYALGSTLWTLLAGHPPFPDDGRGLVERLRSVQHDPVPPIDREDLPDGLEQLLGELLAKDPTQRPTADGLGHRLAAITHRAHARGDTGPPTIDLRPRNGALDEETTGAETGSPAPLPLISPDPRDLLAAPGPFAPGASIAVAEDPELGAPAPPAPWQGRLTSWDELGAQPISREVPTAGGPLGSPAAMAAPVGSAPASVAWADATRPVAGPAASGWDATTQAPPAGVPIDQPWGDGSIPPVASAPRDPSAPPRSADPSAPRRSADPSAPRRSAGRGQRRRWPVVLATIVVMLLAAGATLAVLSRSRSDQDTIGTTDSTQSTTTVAENTTTVPTTAAPSPVPPPPTAAPAPTNATPAPTPGAVPAGTGQVSIPAGTDPTVAAGATSAQQAATALADGNWAVARSLVPQLAGTSDRKLAEGWGNLERATVAVTGSRANPDGTLALRLGVVAHERNTDGSPRTNLYCATWTMTGNQVTKMSDDQVVGGQPWKAGTWVAPQEGIDLLRASCRPLT